MRNAGLEGTQAGIKIAGRNINNLRYIEDITLMAEREEELKSLLMKVKSESEVTQSCPTLETPWTAAYQAPLSMGFSRQKYWSGVPLPSPDQPREHIKKQRHYFANKALSSQSYGFSSSHVWM